MAIEISDSVKNGPSHSAPVFCHHNANTWPLISKRNPSRSDRKQRANRECCRMVSPHLRYRLRNRRSCVALSEESQCRLERRSVVRVRVEEVASQSENSTAEWRETIQVGSSAPIALHFRSCRTCPPFITNTTRRTDVMSSSGLPAVAMMSASMPVRSRRSCPASAATPPTSTWRSQSRLSVAVRRLSRGRRRCSPHATHSTLS